MLAFIARAGSAHLDGSSGSKFFQQSSLLLVVVAGVHSHFPPLHPEIQAQNETPPDGGDLDSSWSNLYRRVR